MVKYWLLVTQVDFYNTFLAHEHWPSRNTPVNHIARHILRKYCLILKWERLFKHRHVLSIHARTMECPHDKSARAVNSHASLQLGSYGRPNNKLRYTKQNGCTIFRQIFLRIVQIDPISECSNVQAVLESERSRITLSIIAGSCSSAARP